MGNPRHMPNYMKVSKFGLLIKLTNLAFFGRVKYQKGKFEPRIKVRAKFGPNYVLIDWQIKINKSSMFAEIFIILSLFQIKISDITIIIQLES